MIEQIRMMFSYGFFVRAAVVGILVSLCAALLGSSLVLRRYSMIGDGLSHVGFGALAIAAAMGVAPLKLTIPVVVVAAILLLRISENSSIRGDAAIAMISTAALATGVVVMSFSPERNADLNSYLFGSILSMSKEDVRLSAALSVLVLVLFVFFYNKLFAITFDETFARATGIRVRVYNLLIAVLTAMTIVLGMRMMGALLISSLIIFPPLSAMRVCKRFRSVVLLSGVLSAICFMAGLMFSYLASTPTGASIVLANAAVFLFFAALGRREGQ